MLLRNLSKNHVYESLIRKLNEYLPGQEGTVLLIMPNGLLSDSSGYLHDIIENNLNKVLRDHNVKSFEVFLLSNYFFVVALDSPKLLNEDLIFNIFKSLQLTCVTEEFLNYKIASIRFPFNNLNAEELIESLLLTQTDNNSLYHFNCNKSSSLIKQVLKETEESFILKEAINENRLKFAFQPVISCKSGVISHFECLLRIIDKNNEYLSSAGPYITTAEKQGFIALIDSLVVDMAIEELSRAKDITLAINISNHGISNKHLIDKLEKNLQDSSLSSRLIIEITETAAQHSFEDTKDFIKTIRKLGTKIAIDDFGAGYTSFRQLKVLPIDLVKIDGWFIKDLVNNMDNKFFVETLVKMAGELGAKTIAEFVENGEIAKFLLDIEVDFMQGNYFSPAVSFRHWVPK